jgi:hypothetical protein
MSANGDDFVESKHEVTLSAHHVVLAEDKFANGDTGGLTA